MKDAEAVEEVKKGAFSGQKTKIQHQETQSPSTRNPKQAQEA